VIYQNQPEDWEDLQNKVCSILTVCGLRSETEKDIDTVRGNVEIDVYATDPTTPENLIYVCECKHWNTAVPKNVVHGFRTVTSDIGAHVGLIIAKSGFQSGAFDTAINSNVKLLTWYEFQELFIDRWKESRYQELKSLFEELFEYYDYLSAPIGNAISGNQDRLDEYSNLIKRFSAQAAANPWNRIIDKEKFPPELPFKTVEIDQSGLTIEVEFEDYSSLFNWFENQSNLGLSEFQNFVAKNRTGAVGE